MLLEICIPGLTALLACVYYNRDEFKGEKDVEGRRKAPVIAGHWEPGRGGSGCELGATGRAGFWRKPDKITTELASTLGPDNLRSS